jgi:hypothetical protein
MRSDPRAPQAPSISSVRQCSNLRRLQGLEARAYTFLHDQSFPFRLSSQAQQGLDLPCGAHYLIQINFVDRSVLSDKL